MDDVVISAYRLTRILTTCLQAAGYPASSADAVAAHLVDAEMKGVSSHGANRLA